MPTSIVHKNFCSRAFSMLLLVTSGLKNTQALTRFIWVLILIVSLVPRSSAAQAASLQKSDLVPAISGLTTRISEIPPINFPTDGIYLYGQSSESGEIGSEYIVFETRDAMIVGALYMPYSSFDCFYGSVEANQLSLTVINSYDQEPHPYSIAIHQDSTVVNASGGAATNSLSLEGFHHIDTLAEMDQQVLEVCRAEHYDQVW